ncbi:A24 family peptidase [Paenibacillus soyae]|uniref:Prepilin peptidase n=1 Tax=Paenibacillus soyae TaxID=2969249 RepID=A0A9X2ML64_9BACL|nr:prepilin peptidase [Paenibacillus soyae]MCR2802350.1 prepilin peptidase [Paenibacillus soyae]
MVVASAAFVLLLIAFISDLIRQTIPNWLTGSAFVTGLLYQGLLAGTEGEGWLWSIGGAAAGFLPLLILYALGGIGAGDVKLFGGLGAWLGAAAVMQLMLYAILYAGAIGVVMLLFHRGIVRNMIEGLRSVMILRGALLNSRWFSWARSGKSFPFMLAVAPAAFTLWMA